MHVFACVCVRGGREMNKRLYFYKDNLRKKGQCVATKTLSDIPQAYVNPVK